MRTSARPSAPFSSGQQLYKESRHPLSPLTSKHHHGNALSLSRDVFLLSASPLLFRGIIYPAALMKFCGFDKRTVKRLMGTP